MTRKGNTALGIATIFIIIFAVGLVSIPLLYRLSTRANGRNSGQKQAQARNKEQEQVKRAP